MAVSGFSSFCLHPWPVPEHGPEVCSGPCGTGVPLDGSLDEKAIVNYGIKSSLQVLHQASWARRRLIKPSCIRGCREEAGWSILVSRGDLLPLFHVFHCLSLYLSPGPYRGSAGTEGGLIVKAHLLFTSLVMPKQCPVALVVPSC